jgi:hypothetical protein
MPAQYRQLRQSARSCREAAVLNAAIQSYGSGYHTVGIRGNNACQIHYVTDGFRGDIIPTRRWQFRQQNPPLHKPCFRSVRHLFPAFFVNEYRDTLAQLDKFKCLLADFFSFYWPHVR